MIASKVEDETFTYSDKFLKLLDTSKDKNEILDSLKQMLVELLLKSKFQRTEESVNILFKLCAENRPKLLNEIDFYKALPSSYCLQNIQTLNEHKRYHSMALIYHLMNKNEEAFSIWKKYDESHFYLNIIALIMF